tara:strand:+ start:17866 stop:18120 length:255 start_codon:yes stop_codon:yes gene_type:complete
VYYRIIGKVGWFESACPKGLGSQCSFSVYPLHNIYVFVALIIGAGVLYFLYDKNIFTKIGFWICIGAILNLVLDYIHLKTGIGI